MSRMSTNLTCMLYHCTHALTSNKRSTTEQAHNYPCPDVLLKMAGRNSSKHHYLNCGNHLQHTTNQNGKTGHQLMHYHGNHAEEPRGGALRKRVRHLNGIL